VIPADYVTQWRKNAPWTEDSQVEQDLIISRALAISVRLWTRFSTMRPIRS
jgi:hypothetical protein